MIHSVIETLSTLIPHLCLEDLDVGSEEVLPLHALLAGHRAHQEGGVNVLESNKSRDLQLS